MKRAILAGAIAGCLQPTQITVAITTDLSCDRIEKTQVFVGPPNELGAASGETMACKGNDIGTIVLTPSKRGGELQVRAVTTLKGGQCDAATHKGCIQADRLARFIAHSPLVLPIEMSTACIDILCPIGETCLDGRCAPIPVLGMDGGIEAGIDAGMEAGPDAGIDAGPMHCPPEPFIPMIPPPSLAWHFDEGMGTTTSEEAMRVPQAMIGATWVAGPSGCGSALHFDGSTTVVLGDHPAMNNAMGITIAFWFRGTTQGTLIDKHDSSHGFDAFVNCFELYGMQVDTLCPIAIPMDNKWHHLAISVAAPTQVVFWVDGGAANKQMSLTGWTPSPGIPLVVGTNAMVDLDEILIWDHPL